MSLTDTEIEDLIETLKNARSWIGAAKDEDPVLAEQHSTQIKAAIERLTELQSSPGDSLRVGGFCFRCGATISVERADRFSTCESCDPSSLLPGGRS